MAFQFRFESLLRYRRSLEEAAQQRLANQLMLFEAQKEKLAGLKHSKQGLLDEKEERQRQGISGAMYGLHIDTLKHVERAIIQQTTMCEVEAKAVKKAMEEVGERMKERKIIEMTREKDYQQYVHEDLKRQEKEGDEQVLLRFGREGA